MNKWVTVAASLLILVGITTIGYLVTARNDQANPEPGMAARFSDACTLVSKPSAEQAFDLRFQRPKKQPTTVTPTGAKVTTCRFQEENDRSQEALLKATELTVKIESYQAVAAAKAAISAIKKSADSGDQKLFVVTEVAGIGDDAFFFQGQNPELLKTKQSLYVRTENQILQMIAVRIEGIDHAQARTALTKLAREALDNN